jgi:hypothetical protein
MRIMMNNDNNKQQRKLKIIVVWGLYVIVRKYK